MMLPNGAKAIIAERAGRGRKPADMIIVSLIGKVEESNPIVYANPAAEYDWRWTVDLKICIYANQKTQWRDIAMRIARSRPEWLGIWNVDAFAGATAWALPRVEDIEKPQSKWRYKLDCLPWLDFQNHEFAFSN